LPRDGACPLEPPLPLGVRLWKASAVVQSFNQPWFNPSTPQVGPPTICPGDNANVHCDSHTSRLRDEQVRLARPSRHLPLSWHSSRPCSQIPKLLGHALQSEARRGATLMKRAPKIRRRARRYPQPKVPRYDCRCTQVVHDKHPACVKLLREVVSKTKSETCKDSFHQVATHQRWPHACRVTDLALWSQWAHCNCI